MLPDLIRRGRNPRVGITVSRATIALRITATAATPEACQQLIDPTAAIIRECLRDLVFGHGEDELQDAVVRLLDQARQTLASVEYGPGGLLAHGLSGADPDGRIYRGGGSLRDPPPAESHPSAPLPEAKAAETLLAVAEQAKARFTTDWCLAVGPFPPADSAQQPAGQFPLALVGPTGTLQQSLPFAGHPDVLPARTAKQGLDLLRQQLLKTQRQASPDARVGS